MSFAVEPKGKKTLNPKQLGSSITLSRGSKKRCRFRSGKRVKNNAEPKMIISTLISNVYTVFEVVEEKQLIPQYLMLWFSRPEFDRFARFKSHGSVRNETQLLKRRCCVGAQRKDLIIHNESFPIFYWFFDIVFAIISLQKECTHRFVYDRCKFFKIIIVLQADLLFWH